MLQVRLLRALFLCLFYQGDDNRRTIIEGINVVYDEVISLDELREYVEDEKAIWHDKGKALASIEVKIYGQDVEITSRERSPITWLRRITGYLSTLDRFNDAKQAELKARQVHMR